MNNNAQQVYNYSSYGILIVCVIFLFLYAYEQYWPVKIIEHHFEVAKILNPDRKVKRGEYLEFEYRYSKYSDIAGTVCRILVNDRIVHFTPDTGVLPKGINQNKIISVYIPKNIFPGKYKLVTHITYPLRGDRRIEVNYDTEWFEVLE